VGEYVMIYKIGDCFIGSKRYQLQRFNIEGCAYAALFDCDTVAPVGRSLDLKEGYTPEDLMLLSENIQEFITYVGNADSSKDPITSKNYVSNVLRTESMDMAVIRSRLQEEMSIRLLHVALGLVTEAGEFADMIKKFIFYGKQLDYKNAKEEGGDSFWYLGVLCDILKTTMDDVLGCNIEKLRKRYPEKFTEFNALNRDVENELSHINSHIENLEV
jgi:NTP pyrophosphatase (non-canonical NTP hydrolase)